MTNIIVTDSDEIFYADATRPVKLTDSDSLQWDEFQDDDGDVIVADEDTLTWTEAAYAEYAVNPFQEMHSIALSIAPYYEITLGLLAHL